MDCPKCGYARRASETAPENQCPSCGVYYAKIPEPVWQTVRTGPLIEAEPRRSWGLGKALLFALFATGAGAALFTPMGRGLLAVLKGPTLANYELRSPDGRHKLSEMDFSRAYIVMYSLTTCGYCAELRRTFEANHVPFHEYFIDTDQSRREELFSKLEFIGFKGGVGTPTLEVNGRMMPNNPPVEDIIKQALSM